MTEKFRFGIEEEYFLADAKTGCAPRELAADAFHKVAADIVKPASHELLKGQVEVQTEPGTDFDEARATLAGMRRDLSKIAVEHGLTLFAAGSHPLAQARDQDVTEKDRYRKLHAELGIIAQRTMVCATHIHVEVADVKHRIELMNRIVPFLPLFFALSVSSPFWQGRDAGIKGFRLTAFSEWPRMGVPDLFASQAEYQRFVDLLVAAEIMEDASFVWWHIRPSTQFPTIELRVCDGCPRVDDAVAIAALYQAVMRAAIRHPDLNKNMGPIDRAVCAENIWQVQQFGVDATLIDTRRRSKSATGALLRSARARGGRLRGAGIVGLGGQDPRDHPTRNERRPSSRHLPTGQGKGRRRPVRFTGSDCKPFRRNHCLVAPVPKRCLIAPSSAALTSFCCWIKPCLDAG